jgi:hypothetical protein
MTKVAECMEDDFCTKGGNATSFTTHHEGEYWKCSTNCKWPKKGPEEEVG